MYFVFSFYGFQLLDNILAIQNNLRNFFHTQDIFGTILLSEEGINGHVAADESTINMFRNLLNKLLPEEILLVSNITVSDIKPFTKKAVKIKPEIIKFNCACLNLEGGIYLSPSEWHQHLQKEDIVLIDARNKYEVNIGKFKGAKHFDINTFTEFHNALVQELAQVDQHAKIYMYCTGGVRCAKTTDLCKKLGYSQVYHLRGGIIAYLNDFKDRTDSLWEGDCYVFDHRVAINHAAEPANYVKCFACRQPVSAVDQASETYVPGISCSSCINDSKVNREKFIERTLARQTFNKLKACG